MRQKASCNPQLEIITITQIEQQVMKAIEINSIINCFVIIFW